MSTRPPADGGLDELAREPGPSERRADDSDVLNLAYGGKAVCDSQHRAAIHDAVEGLLDEALALRVERSRRLAQRNDKAELEPTRDPGFRAPAAKPHPALAELCAVTLRQTLDRLHQRRRPGRRPADFRLRRPGTAMADLVDSISGNERGTADRAPEPCLDLRPLRALKGESL